MEEQGLTIDQSWTQGGVTQNGWPRWVDLGRGETLEGTLSMAMTNDDPVETARFDLEVTIDAGGGGVPEPSAEDLRLQITLEG